MNTDNLRSREKIIIISITIIIVLVFAGVFYIRNQRSTNDDFEISQCVQQEEKDCYGEYLQIGMNYESENDWDRAIRSYQKAAELSPKSYVPFSNIGSVYYRMQKFPEAEAAFLKAIELNHNNVSVYTKLYDLYFYGMKRSPQQMAAFFKDAMNDTNNAINLVKLYALYLEQINEPESALPIWQSLLKVEPKNALYKAKISAILLRLRTK